MKPRSLLLFLSIYFYGPDSLYLNAQPDSLDKLVVEGEVYIGNQKGIRLSPVDRPLITRSFDRFVT